jgi:ATP-dependent helicase HrpA
MAPDLSIADLPIAAAVPEIAAALLASQVVVVAGETGSGKTTQLPKICLLAGRERLGHTQPRRIAARTLAERIAEETRTEVGDLVGYQVRFTRKAGRQTRVKVMTDGILLAEIAHDRLLERYDTIIVDEAHERSLNIDFLLGYLKQLLPKRPDLKVIVTSATIDTARFSEHFDNAPIVSVEGRTYPVEVRYRPVRDDGAVDDSDDDPATEAIERKRATPVRAAVEKDLNEAICDAVVELQAEGDGDILVFLSGEREIRDAADAITALDLRFTEVLPLYARLSAAEQHRVFAPHAGRRIVLATNVAETSLTVPGIRYVIDPGTARISRYSKRTKVQRLPIEPISRASANQRAGRCGRVAPGICIRLYSQADYESRPKFTEPEILRTNLASVILQMAESDLGDIATFPFVEPPDESQITDGLRLLEELGALEQGSRARPTLTATGHSLARLPVDPRLGRMLVQADRLGCLREVLVVVSALAIPDVRERPAEAREKADLFHRRFWTASPNPGSGPATGSGTDAATPSGTDFGAIVNLWEYLRDQRKLLSGNAFRRMCRDEFLSFLRIREWQDLHTQLRDICDELGLSRNHDAAPPERVHTALLSGLLSHVGLLDVKDERPDLPARKRARLGPREYLGSRGSRWAINPGSALAKTPPPLAMAYELVETTRLWARTVAGVTAEQVEEVGSHLLKRNYSEPHWAESTGSVVAYESVSLYGVPIVSGRPVSYARIDPAEARRIFIQAALVEGRWRTRHHFFDRNEATRRAAADLEERTRRRDIVVDDAVIADFYNARIPSDVVSVQHFDAWWRRKRQESDNFLDLSLDDLVVPEADDVDAGGFPDHWIVAGHALPITYVFDPGSHHDGVTVEIPLPVLNQLPPAAFTWQVPGLRHDLATELIRSLPKAVRTAYVPAPNHAAAALAWLAERPDVASAPVGDLAPDTISFPAALSRALLTLTGRATGEQWGVVPDHLSVTLVVADRPGGTEVARGTDLAELQRRLAPRLTETLTRASRDVAVTGASAWTFPELAPRRVTKRGETEIVGYPALVDEGRTVGVSVLDTEVRARRSHAAGLRRLFVVCGPDPTKWVVAHMSNDTKLTLGASPYPGVADLLGDVRLKAIDAALADLGVDPWEVRSSDRFTAVGVGVRERVPNLMRTILARTGEALARYQAVQRLITSLPPSDVRTDVSEQVSNLVFSGFVAATPDPWFARLPVYLRAATVRLEAYGQNPARWRQATDTILDLEDAYAALCAHQPPGPLPPPIARIGWLMEELRVSLFAQSLGTTEPVSAKRLRSLIAAA